MKTNNLIPFLLVIVLFWACDTNESVPETENVGPTATDQTFMVSEDIPSGQLIGVVEAIDKEGDILVFSLLQDESGLFEISEDGGIRLTEGQNLDFETKDTYHLTVLVSDAINDPIEFIVTILILDDGDLADDPLSFVTKWQVGDGQEITIGTNASFVYEYVIDWGDGTLEELTDQNPSHLYQKSGIYTVAIKGLFPSIRMFESDQLSKKALLDIVQWGGIQWQDLRFALYECSNVDCSAIDTPDLSQITSLYATFKDAKTFNGNIADWDISNVTYTASMFSGASSFDVDISNWDVSNVVNMANMFKGATRFNKPIGIWKVGNVHDMSAMFYGASAFNHDISEWNVSNVTNMNEMFRQATTFNQDISTWNISKVLRTSCMFWGAASFNQDIGSWDTSQVISMQSMFIEASSFDQNLANWHLSGLGQVYNMQFMFDNSGMSPTNMNSTLVGWSGFVEQNAGPWNITLGMQNISICGPEVNEAMNSLSSIYNWVFNGGGNFQNCD